MIDMKLSEMKMKQLVEEFNKALIGLKVEDSIYQDSIKNDIFNHLKVKFPSLKLRNVDIHYNRFEVEYEYTQDFLGIKEFDKGSVTLEFSIRNKKTDKLKKVSPTRKKYVYTRHEKPVSFVCYNATSWMANFDWKDEEDSENVEIYRSGSTYKSGFYGKDKNKTIDEMLEEIKSGYEADFRLNIVQPYVKSLFFKGRKYNSFYNLMPSKLKKAIENKEDNVFSQIADFVLEQNLIAS